MSMILIAVVMIGVLFFMQRGQKKQAQERQNQLSNMKPGDEVVTIGGLHGVLSEANADSTTVTIDCEGVFLEFDRNAIKTVKSVQSDVLQSEVVETEEIEVVEAETEPTSEENKED